MTEHQWFDASPRVRVIAGVMRRGDLFFVARRSPDQRLAGKWEFPGGKVEPGETDEETLARELWEELGIHVKVGEFIASNKHQYHGGKPFELFAYEVEWDRTAMTLTVHDAIQWLPLSELRELDLAAADVPLLEGLVKP